MSCMRDIYMGTCVKLAGEVFEQTADNVGRWGHGRHGPRTRQTRVPVPPPSTWLPSAPVSSSGPIRVLGNVGYRRCSSTRSCDPGVIPYWRFHSPRAGAVGGGRRAAQRFAPFVADLITDGLEVFVARRAAHVVHPLASEAMCAPSGATST